MFGGCVGANDGGCKISFCSAIGDVMADEAGVLDPEAGGGGISSTSTALPATTLRLKSVNVVSARANLRTLDDSPAAFAFACAAVYMLIRLSMVDRSPSPAKEKSSAQDSLVPLAEDNAGDMVTFGSCLVCMTSSGSSSASARPAALLIK